VIARTYSEIFTDNHISTITPDLDIHSVVPLMDIDFNVLDITDLLKNLPNKCNTSPDGINNKILRACYMSMAPFITEIFRISLDSGTIPKIWKVSNITPIPKIQGANQPLDFRPISITCSIARVMEGIVARLLIKHMIDNKLMHSNQFAFVPKGSTVSQLILQFENWYTALYENKCIDVLFLDFKKAFDNVPSNLLIAKLKSYGVGGKIIAWLAELLKNRTFRVKVQNSYSIYNQRCASRLAPWSCVVYYLSQ